MAAEFYEDSAGETRWRVKAGNNRTLGNSGEGYHNEIDAYRGLLALVENVDLDELRAQISDMERRQRGNPQ